MEDPAQQGGPGENEPQSVDRLLESHRAEIFAYLLAGTRNRHDAEDLLQEVSAEILRMRHEYRPGTSFTRWARTIARFRILKHFRRSRRQAAALLPEALDRLEAAAGKLEAEEPLDEQAGALRRCLAKLTGMRRRVLGLHYENGLKIDAVARAVGKSVSACYSVLKRAKQALRLCIENSIGRTPHRRSRP